MSEVLAEQLYSYWRQSVLAMNPAAEKSGVVCPPEWKEANGGTRMLFLTVAKGADERIQAQVAAALREAADIVRQDVSHGDQYGTWSGPCEYAEEHARIILSLIPDPSALDRRKP